jgi:hypothetical protein
MELIGEYYRDKVLCLPEDRRKLVELPAWRDNIEIVSDLFGWVLKYGKVKIQCRSEEEARFLWVYWSFYMTEIWIPSDDKYLTEILPRLLVLKEGHDEVVEEKISVYSNRRVREELKRQIFLGATLRDEDEDEEVESEIIDISNTM